VTGRVRQAFLASGAERYRSHHRLPDRWPLPNPSSRKVSSPPEDGYRVPSLATTEPSRAATIPPSANEPHAAEPAIAPASPTSVEVTAAT